MNKAQLNPYESPQVTDDFAKPDPQEPLTLAELQASVLQLEERLERSHLFGPLWKRCLTVFIHFIFAYVVISLIAVAVFWPMAWLFNWTDF